MAETTGSSATVTTRNNVTVDSNHPFFLHPSDAPGMTLVNSPFDGKGYQGWKRSVLIALSAKNKLGFITGSQASPSAESPDFQIWNRCNDMVISWLLNSLSKDIGDSVIYSHTARELWASLKHRFGQTNGAKLFHLQKELSRLSQGTNNIAAYFTKLKRLWDELDSLNSNIRCTCECICEGKQKLIKSIQDERLIVFLMGLNETYSHARGNILMMNPLPDINHAYSLILQDEHQRESYMNPLISPDSSSFMVNNSYQPKGKQGQRFLNFPQGSTKQYIQPPTQGIQKQNQKIKGRRNKYNPSLTCNHCGKVGHAQEDCYRIIGYPEDFQFTNNKGFQGQIRGNNVVAGEDLEDRTGKQSDIRNMNNFSQEQYNTFLQMFKQMKTEEGSQSHSGTDISSNAVAGLFNEEGSSFW